MCLLEGFWLHNEKQIGEQEWRHRNQFGGCFCSPQERWQWHDSRLLPTGMERTGWIPVTFWIENWQNSRTDWKRRVKLGMTLGFLAWVTECIAVSLTETQNTGGQDTLWMGMDTEARWWLNLGHSEFEKLDGLALRYWDPTLRDLGWSYGCESFIQAWWLNHRGV